MVCIPSRPGQCNRIYVVRPRCKFTHWFSKTSGQFCSLFLLCVCFAPYLIALGSIMLIWAAGARCKWRAHFHNLSEVTLAASISFLFLCDLFPLWKILFFGCQKLNRHIFVWIITKLYFVSAITARKWPSTEFMYWQCSFCLNISFKFSTSALALLQHELSQARYQCRFLFC